MNSQETAHEILSKNQVVEDLVFDTFGYFDLEDKDYGVIEFLNCTFNDRVLFTRCNHRLTKFSFEKCTFNHAFGITDFDYIESLLISDCSIKKSFFFEKIKTDSLLIQGSGSKKLTFKHSLIDSLDIIESAVSEQFDLISITSSYVTITNQTKLKNYNLVRVNSPEIEHLEIDLNGNIHDLKLFGFQNAEVNSVVENFSVNTGEFKQLNVGVTSHEKRPNSRIGAFRVVNIKQQGSIRFNEIFLRNLKLLDVDASSTTYFFNEVVVENTSIDGCIFSKFYCNLLVFINDPEILRSDVTGFVINNLNWGKRKTLKDHDYFDDIPILYRFREKKMIKADKGYDAEDKVALRHLKDTYRQLKKASLANSNLIDALQFHANEMQTYWREVRLIGGNSFGDTALIFLNRWSSNFGQSWILPLVWLFLFQTIFFSLIMSFYWNNTFSGNFEFGQFWVLLNPVHKTPDYVNTGTGLFTEFIMRVVNAYFIYHFIKATRKFGKV